MKHVEKIKLNCDICGTEFYRYPSQIAREGQGRYCSRKCQIEEKKHGSNIPCVKCGKLFYRRYGEQGDTKNQFCSRECYSSYRYENLKDTTYKKVIGRHEHRIVVENVIGRKLLSTEIVHHIDGDKHNNDITNLALLPSQKIHAEIHFGGSSVDKYKLINIIKDRK